MQKKKEILERANNKPNYSITHDMTNIYTEAFSIFFKIGAFTIGGGYAMVPLIEDEIVTKRRWIAKEDFIDLLAIAHDDLLDRLLIGKPETIGPFELQRAARLAHFLAVG